MRWTRNSRWAALRLMLATIAILPLSAGRGSAEITTLRLSFFTSDRSSVYQCHVKPFVDAVNAEHGTLRIEVYFSGAISPSQAEQPNLVLSGAADIAFIIPGTTPQQFPDSFVLALPGLFKTDQEGSTVFTRLVRDDALEGYGRFFVIGAHLSSAEIIHSRKPIASLADLRGQKIRVNNEISASILQRLGAVPVSVPLNRTMDALSSGVIDGVAVDPSVLEEFGLSRLAQNHYFLMIGSAPLALVMSKEKLASLPSDAQEVIRKYSGEWFVKQETACADTKVRQAIAQIRAAPNRHVVDPSPADMAIAQAVFGEAIHDWTAVSPHNRQVMEKLIGERNALRTEQQ